MTSRRAASPSCWRRSGSSCGPQIAHRLGELGRAGRRLAQPEGHGRRKIAGVVDPHRAHLDLGHPPRVGAEEEDVPRHRLHREVLVHRPDRDALGVEHDPVVAGLGNGATAGQRGQTGAAAGPQAAVDRVVVQMGAPPSPPGLDAPAGQGHDVVEVLAGQVGVGGGPAGHLPQLLDAALLDRGHFGHQLLGQHVERGDRGLEQVEPARRARRPAARCTRPARRGSWDRGARPASRPAGGWPARPAGERSRWRGASRSGRPAPPARRRCPAPSEAVATRARRSPARRRVSTMRRRAAERLPWCAATRSEASTSPPPFSALAQPLGQLMGHPLGHLAGVDEDQRRAVLAACARRCGRGCRRTAARSPPLRARCRAARWPR